MSFYWVQHLMMQALIDLGHSALDRFFKGKRSTVWPI